MTNETPAVRMDDWAQVFGALGSIKDKSLVAFSRRARLDRTQLLALYEQNPLAARYVDLIVNDALRGGGWKLSGLTPEETTIVEKKLRDLQFNENLATTAKWSRLFGAAGLVLPVVDGRKQDEPVHVGGVKAIYTPAPFPAHEITPNDMDVGFGSPTFRKVLTYDINGALGESMTVHRQRIIVFEPVQLPPDALLYAATRWGPSVLERLFDSLGRYGGSVNHAVAMMYIASILYIQIEGYRQVTQTADGKAKMTAVLESMRRGLDSLGLLGLDKADNIGNVTLTNFGQDLIEKTKDDVAAAADMPREILFNESPAGLNAGELSGPQELWFAKVESYRTEQLQPAIEQFLRIALPAWGICSEWYVEWEPLWNKSTKESSETAARNATTDATYIELGVVTTDEVRQHRFVEGRDDQLVVVDTTAVEAEPLEITPEDIQAPTTTTEKVADEALNGAQISSLVEIVEKVQSGLIPRDSAIQIIAAAFPSVAHKAEQVLGSAGSQLPAAVPQSMDEQPSQAPPPADLVSPRDAGAALGVPTRSITMAIATGDLAYWGIGKHKRVSLAEVAALAKRHEETHGEEETTQDPGQAAT